MNSIKNNNNIVKDKTKGQKIAAAIYLVTNHMSDMDPLRVRLRERVLMFLTSSESEISTHTQILEALLSTATIAGIISEKNASIISYEAQKFAEYIDQSQELLPAFFTTEDVLKKDSFSVSSYEKMSYKKNEKGHKNVSTSYTIKNNNESEKKSERGTIIMSFMSTKKTATIKDIVGLFPLVSEKTIQRELGSLVVSGKLTKRGNKRWSVYILSDESHS